MKCESIACLWSKSPLPFHKVTALATFSEPPTLYTGGSDGSIIWWNFSSTARRSRGSGRSTDFHSPYPFALLCGHASKITDLTTCVPTVRPEIPRILALLSACVDGVLCVWIRGSGHCRKRRKLPAWAGIPCTMTPVTVTPRYVCVACCSVDTHGAGSEGLDVDGEWNLKKGGLNSKHSVLIVDSCSLNVVKTVFHVNSGLGELSRVLMVRDFEVGIGEDKNQTFALIDVAGKVQLVEEAKVVEGEEGSGVSRSSSLNSNTLSPLYDVSLTDGEEDTAVFVAVCGKILVLVFKTCCVFKSVLTGLVAGKISLMETPIHDQGQLAGCVFLHDDNCGCELDKEEVDEGIEDILVLWNTKGSAVAYAMRVLMKNSSIQLHFEPLCKIEGYLHNGDEQNSFRFCKLDGCIARVESFCSNVGVSMIWRPHITIWSAPWLPMHSQREQSSGSGHSDNLCMSAQLGQGGFPVSFGHVNQVREMTHSNESESEIETSRNDEAIPCVDEQVVSSSMILSEDSYGPYAVVYGFFTGHIEVIRFGNSSTGSRNIPKQTFYGHTGAILCLEAHRMIPTSKEEHAFHKVLISGSLDWTIRLWDLDSDSLLFVLHHHVSPIKQIILPPPQTDPPWCNCFLSVGDDCCVALVSLETFCVERMFPGHPCPPSMVVWDSTRDYIACLCRNLSSLSHSSTALYLWDVKTGARERVFRDTFSYSVFDYFCRGININTITGNILGGSSSASLLPQSVIGDSSLQNYRVETVQKGNEITSQRKGTINSSCSLTQDSKVTVQIPNITSDTAGNHSVKQVLPHSGPQKENHPIKYSCPFPGIAVLQFDLASLMSSYQMNKHDTPISGRVLNTVKSHKDVRNIDVCQKSSHDTSKAEGSVDFQTSESLEEYQIRSSLGLLHLWDVNLELDKILMDKMNILKHDGLFVVPGVPGDGGSMMLTFPGLHPSLQLWKSSSEFCAMRSLTIVSLAQRLITISHSSTTAASTLTAFYTRNFAKEVPDVMPPLLQLLVSFWQDPSEHVRMAARSLFNCAAPQAIPHPLCCKRTSQLASPSISLHPNEEYPPSSKNDASEDSSLDSDYTNQHGEVDIVAWLESYEIQDWISCIGGTVQDAMASHIIVAAALAVWYPSIVRVNLANLVVNHLLNLVMSINDQYSSTAAELLAEGMERTWKKCIDSEIPKLIKDIFFQIECLSSTSSTNSKQNPARTINIREALVTSLLPSLAMTDVPGFLQVIKHQISASSSNSPVHVVSVTTIIRVIRGSPKTLAPYLDKAINLLLQTLDHANPVMRKICLQSSMVALKEAARVFPMIALSEANSRLAVGNAIGDINNITIGVYDLQSMAKVKVLDASRPPGHPSLLLTSSDAVIDIAISSVSFSPDGDGLVAFSECGLVIRWWTLGNPWWEKLSKNLVAPWWEKHVKNMVPVQCTKLIFVPPWEGISPDSSRTSIFASMAGLGHDKHDDGVQKSNDDDDNLGTLIRKIDFSYRLDWIDGRKAVLSRHKHELGTFQF